MVTQIIPYCNGYSKLTNMAAKISDMMRKQLNLVFFRHGENIHCAYIFKYLIMKWASLYDRTFDRRNQPTMVRQPYKLIVDKPFIFFFISA